MVSAAATAAANCCHFTISPEKYFHTRLSLKFFLLPTSTCRQGKQTNTNI
jgi:hypothetical protein